MPALNNQPSNQRKYLQGHKENLREEISSYLEDMTSCELSPEQLDKYIETQVEMVIKGMYEEILDDPEDGPEHEFQNPDTVPHDYYRENIDQFGTLYTDYAVM